MLKLIAASLVICWFGCGYKVPLETPPGTVSDVTSLTQWAKVSNDDKIVAEVRNADPGVWNEATTFLRLLNMGEHVHLSQPLFSWVNAAYSRHIQLDHYTYLFKMKDGSVRYVFQEYLTARSEPEIAQAVKDFHKAKLGQQQWTANRMQLPRYGYRGQQIAKERTEAEMKAIVLQHSTSAKNVIAMRFVWAQSEGHAIHVTNEFEYYVS